MRRVRVSFQEELQLLSSHHLVLIPEIMLQKKEKFSVVRKRNHVAENTFPKVRKNKTCGRYEISTYECGVAETVFGTNATLSLALISGRIPTVTKSQFKFVL